MQKKQEITPALGFGLPLLFVPLLVVSWFFGGLTILLAPIFGYVIITVFDFFSGEEILEPKANEDNLWNYKLMLWIWPFIQLFLIFGSLITIFRFSHFGILEAVGLMLVQGMITGAVGITFAHELMHQKTRREQLLSDSLMGMALYGHFRTEHVLVHHRYVGTEKDAVTARFDENFYEFFVRILPACIVSAWSTETDRLARLGKSKYDKANPFWIYLAFPFIYLLLSFAIGGTLGMFLFFLQALVGVLHLEVVNYIEHYGLSRQVLENGKFETTKPYHSWNANHKASNRLLINLQKHSDHHTKPNKSYALLQSHDHNEAPQLPYGYPLMVVLSLIPSLWKRVMNPRVLNWRKQFYPEVVDWSKLST